MKVVNFLRHSISKKSILVDATKIQSILEWPTPKTVTGI